VCVCVCVCVCVRVRVCERFPGIRMCMDIALLKGPKLKLVKMKTRPELLLRAVNFEF